MKPRVILLLSVATACASDPMGRLDAETGDVLASDVEVLDAGVDTSSPMDVDMPDMRMVDAGPMDTGPMDTGPMCERVRVEVGAGEVLNVRADPSTANPRVGSLQNGTVVELLDTVTGENVGGETLWFQIRSPFASGYVHSDFAVCTDEPLTVDEGYYLPFACGTSVRVTQAPGGTLSHTGRTMYAYDFGVGLNTPVHAMRAGRVTATRGSTRPGDPCYNGGGPSCGVEANWVILLHADGNTSAYKHLNEVRVSVGDNVSRGQVIGLSGSTGYSTGPHLHQELRGNCPTEIYCQTIQLTFADVGRPSASTNVVSGNCP